jgi:hypothetical protein
LSKVKSINIGQNRLTFLTQEEEEDEVATNADEKEEEEGL